MTCVCKRKGTNCGACDDTAPDAPGCDYSPPNTPEHPGHGVNGNASTGQHRASGDNATLVRLRAEYAARETSAIAEEYTRHRRTRETTVDPRIKAYAERQCQELIDLLADREGKDTVPRDHARKGRANWGKHRPSPRGVISPAPRRGRK